ncbi:S1C family serine protease [Congregibacter litoralis]|uniref:Trypsin-like serine protease, typically periplasmic n=1 Tax=Congregibacter litoralis KT71 TaxID=314285 RepID=A4A524_9GAMM|nr:serine protease [Congregibacter litoralis]EAQ98895.1 Trypsin-like serine protease, typically periplasmic [Congregibacter litoralis KT71]
MIYRVTQYCYLLLLSLLLSGGSAAEELPDLLERLTPSVVGVGAAYPLRAPTGGRPPRRLLGTGFVVESEGKSYVVTNAHVIPTDLDSDGREQLAVFSGRGKLSQQRFARLLKNDAQHDLAVLAYEGDRLPAMTLATDDRVRPGERVAFTGFPIGAVLGLYPITHEGIVSAITPVARPADQGRYLDAVQMSRLRKPFDVYQLDAIAYPGNSGSAVYRVATGEVIGVMNSVFVKESRETLLSAPSGIAYAIPVSHLRTLLDEN